VSTTDLSHNAMGARSQQNGRSQRGSASADNGTANAAPTPIDNTNTTPLKNQLSWAPVLLNPQRLASAAIGTLRHGAYYTSELTSIVTGGSPIGPLKGDRRFADPAFTDHPIYRGVMQAYLALCVEVDSAVAEAALGWKDKELLRFYANVVTSSLAPTNVLLGNPAALVIRPRRMKSDIDLCRHRASG
jgi:hypothetical protein